MLKHTLSLVACATLVASLEAKDFILEPISITSNAYHSDELTTTYATEVYTSDEITQSHAHDLYAFLNEQTSLITSSGYGNTFSQKLDIHGYGIGDGYQNIVITLDGRRLNNIDMTSQLLGSIPLNSIERIEILKGAGSVVYGDGANAAVINIITKENGRNELSLYGGNYGTHGESLYLSSAADRYSYALHLDHSDTDGMRLVDPLGNRDVQKSTSGGVRFSYHPTSDLEAHVGAEFTDNDSTYGRPMTLQEYNTNPAQEGSAGFGSTHQTFTSHVINGGLFYLLNKNYSVEIDASQEKKRLNYITYSSIADYSYDEIRTQLNYTDDLIKSSFGMNGTWGERDGFGNITSKDNKSLYATAEYHHANHIFSAGGRYEQVAYQYRAPASTSAQKNDLWASELGYTLALSDTESLFIHYAHAFQAPDIDRFFNFGGTFNGFIQPMKSDTYSAGFTRIYAEHKLKLSAYYADLRNEIYYHASSWTNTNIDQSHKYGIDLSDQWLISDQWNLYTNYNYVQAIIDKEHFNADIYDGKKLPGVSNHNVKATLSYLPNEYTTFALTEIYRSSAYAQEDFSNTFAQKQDPYHTTNISVTYTKDNYEIFAKINNLFDQSNGIWVNDNEIYPVDFARTVSAGLKFIF